MLKENLDLDPIQSDQGLKAGDQPGSEDQITDRAGENDNG
jgi:hypothetical protein